MLLNVVLSAIECSYNAPISLTLTTFHLTPTNSTNYGPNLSCNWTIITNVNANLNLRMKLGIPIDSNHYMDLKMDNCNGGSVLWLYYTSQYSQLYFQEEKICIYFISYANATGNLNWYIDFEIIDEVQYKYPTNFSEPIITFPPNNLTQIMNYSSMIFHSDHGTLQLFFNAFFQNANYNGTFYIYDYDGLRNLEYITSPGFYNNIVPIKATNRTITILFVGKSFDPREGTLEIVARIVEDHSANCATTNNLQFVTSNNDNTMSAFSNGNCIYSFYVSYFDAMEVTKLNYTGNNFVTMVKGYSSVSGQKLLEFGQPDSLLCKGFVLLQGLYSFLIPNGTTLEVVYEDNNVNTYFFNDQIIGIILASTAQLLHLPYTRTIVCMDCEAIYKMTIVYANIKNFMEISFDSNTSKNFTNTNISYMQVQGQGPYFSINYQDQDIVPSDDYGIFIQYSAQQYKNTSTTISRPQTTSIMR
uniref:CUB-like domain-containing protein n=1 Tax=Acrobeloides nanus TaxID=290746 RepID=A0A914C0Y5_9BILA